MKTPRLALAALAMASTFMVAGCDDSKDDVIMTDTPSSVPADPDNANPNGELTEEEAYGKSKDVLENFGG